MAQNIYDDDEFYNRYSQLPRSRDGLESAPEWPSLRAMVGDVAGQRILDLGCGYGWFVRWALESGAERAHGVDISTKMISRAEEFSSDPGLTYSIDNLETIELPEDSFE